MGVSMREIQEWLKFIDQGQPSQSQPDFLPAAIHNAKLVSQRAVHTFQLSVALQATGGTFVGRMQKVAALLKEDAARSDPLIDLSCTVEGDKVSPERAELPTHAHVFDSSSHLLLSRAGRCDSVMRAVSAVALLPLLFVPLGRR